MAKSNEKSSEKQTAGIASVGVAIADAYSKQAKSGELLNTVVAICTRIFKGNPAHANDQTRVADDVARIMQWSAASEGPRKSEVKKMVRVYHRFDEAATAYRKKNPSFTWGVAMRLLTCLGKEKTLKKVLALMAVSNGARPELKPLVAVGKACKRLINLDSVAGSKARLFQDAVQTAADTFGVNYE